MTVDEVNALIPELSLIFQRLIELRREMVARANELERLGYNPTSARPRDLPPAIAARRDTLEACVLAFEREVEKIGSLGGMLQDLDHGVVDFLHDMGGTPVLLCWQSGETRVEHFHGLDEAFSRRTPLPGAIRADSKH